MKKNLFLTTVLLAGLVAPAFADDAATPDKKITGGAGTCTVDVLGVSDNNATANTIATWSLNSYDCAAGQYLDETTLLCTECPVGSYCPGGTFTVEANNSKTACPTDYTSDAAATAESECYTGCELACTQQTCPAHSNNCTHIASSTTGKQYVGGTCDAIVSSCEMNFDCDTGYNKQEMTIAEIQQALISGFVDSQGNIQNLISLYCTATGLDAISDNNMDDCTMVAPGTFSVVFYEQGDGYIPKIGKVTFQIAYNTTPPSEQPGAYTKTYVFADSMVSDQDTFTMTAIPANVQIESSDDFAYMYYKLTEIGFASTEIYDYAINNIGSYETLLNSFETIKVTDKPWLAIEGFFLVNPGSVHKMSDAVVDEMDGGIFVFAPILNEQAFNTMPNLYDDANFKACVSNLINISWNPDNGASATQNMCAYDGTLVLPSDPVKPGYTFTGWKLVEKTTTE